MFSLKKWWDDFCDRAPVADEDINDYCCVVVGNKIDMIVDGKGLDLVSKSDALAFLDELVPPSSTCIYSSPPIAEQDADPPDSKFLTSHTLYEPSSVPSSSLVAQIQTHSNSVDIHTPNDISHSLSPSLKSIPSRSHSSAHFYTGTMSSASTTFTIYHTPSSSFYHSARSSPEPLSLSEPTTPSSSFRKRKLNTRSSSITRSGSASTLTPSIYIRENGSSSNTNTPNNLIPTIITASSSSPSYSPALSSPPPPLERGPKLFFTSAKTGEGVADVFEYIAYRVSRRWEYEEQMQARRVDFPDSSAAETVHLGLDNGRERRGHRCCS